MSVSGVSPASRAAFCFLRSASRFAWPLALGFSLQSLHLEYKASVVGFVAKQSTLNHLQPLQRFIPTLSMLSDIASHTDHAPYLCVCSQATTATPSL